MKKINTKDYLTIIPHKNAKFGYKVRCELCGYKWFPKLQKPVICPSCRQELRK